MIKFGLFIIFSAFGLGQLSSVLGDSLGSIYAFDFGILIWVLVAGLYILISPETHFFLPKTYFWLLGFLIWAGMSLLFSTARLSFMEILVSSFYLVRLVSYLFAGLLVHNFLKQGLFTLDNLHDLVLFLSVLLCLGGFFQLALFPDFRSLDPSLGWDPHIGRFAGAFLDPNFMGATLVLCFNFILAFIDRRRTLSIVILLGLFFGILFTFSRSAWSMFAVSIGLWGFLKYRWLLLASVLIAFLAYFAVPRVQTRLTAITDPTDSAYFRLISWKNTLRIAQDHLVMGTGFNTFRFVQRDYGFFGLDWGGRSGGGADSSLLLVLATTGIPGLLLFSGFLGSAFLRSIRRAGSGLPREMLPLMVSLPALLINSFFINSLFYPPILFMWSLFLAIFFCIEL